MFLDEYLQWEVEGLHHPLNLQEMFLQAAYSGRREVEQMAFQGHLDMAFHIWTCRQMSQPSNQLDPKPVDKRSCDLYYQVYKVRRLPGSLLCGLEGAEAVARDIVSSLKKCPRQKEDELPEVATHPMQSRTPWGERGDILAEVRADQSEEKPIRRPWQPPWL